MTDLLTKLDDFDELELEEKIALVRGAYTPRDVCEQFELTITGDKIRSPFNEADETPSCHLYEDGWFDYSTGKWGDVIDLVVHLSGRKPGQVLRQLAAGVQSMELDPERVRRAEKQVVDLTDLFKDLSQRDLHATFWANRLPGVQLDTLVELHESQYLAEDRAGNLLIPHWGPPAGAGRFIVHGIKIRHTDGSKSSVSGSQFSRSLYDAGHTGMLEHTVAVITEGESDLWAIDPFMGEHVAVYALPSGAGLWRAEWLEELGRYEKVYTAFDNDRAGQQATEKVRSAIGWERWRQLAVPTLFNDVREAISKGWEPKL